MNIYIDESGSINNHVPNNDFFIISLLYVNDKDKLLRAYKRFVSANYSALKTLDAPKYNTTTGKVLKPANRMFSNFKFKELKGSQFDKAMKLKFLEFFARELYFNLFYIKIHNTKLSNKFCSNTARVFNYSLKLALTYFLQHKMLPDEDCNLHLDERNEKTNARYFLENYLNTELSLNNVSEKNYVVTYYDSSNNRLIQLADVFANIYYSHLKTNGYTDEFKKLTDNGMIRYVFNFPPNYSTVLLNKNTK